MINQKFSVLISVYNKEKPVFFEESLSSIFNQSLVPNEVVLVKDGMLTNELDQIISKFKKKYSFLKIVSLSSNVGLGIALSKGLYACSNSIVARMDTDDICDYNRFKKQIDYLNNNPEIDLVGSNISEFISDPNNPTSYRVLPESSEDIYDFGKKRNPINHMTVMFKKDSIIKVGGYKSFMGFEDYYLWVRMFIAKMKFHNIQENLVMARIGNDMIGRRTGIYYIKKEIKLFNKFKEIGYLSSIEYLSTISIRIFVRILPKKILTSIYNHFLRA